MSEIGYLPNKSEVKSGLLKLVPGQIKDLYRGYREGVTFPTTQEVGTNGIKASFVVNSFKERQMIRNFGNEEKVIHSVLNTLTPDKTFVDIGAHVGLYTIFALNNGSNVIAFEPDTQIFKRLKANCDLQTDILSKFDLYNLAIGSDNTFLPIFSQGVTKTSPSVGVDVHGLKKSKLVEVVRMDNFLGTAILNSLVVKVDVEGMENEIVLGMKNLISRKVITDIFVEVHPDLLEKRNQKWNGFGNDFTEIKRFDYGNRYISHYKLTD